MSELSLAKNSAMGSPRLAVARARTLLTELNLHFAGVAVLALLNVYLLAHLFFVWRTISNNNASAVEVQVSQMHAAQQAAEPLRGLEQKVVDATGQADSFSDTRLPFAISQVAAELGSLAKHENVRLTRSQYIYTPVLAGTAHELTEVQMDLSLSGDYRPLVHVVNALERDKLFFLIRSMTLTGQQSGTVNLRLRLATYLRPVKPGEVSKEIAADDTIPVERPAAMPAAAAPLRQAPAAAPNRDLERFAPEPAPAPARMNPPPAAVPAPRSSGATPLRRLVPGRRGLSVPGTGGTR
jgi:hypothetical protein